ncbi:hypothetical protein PILCRDRAFT_821554 [Piloderma croceum F 1598]|uniref:Uncharacterized protein n=1 Tax=Piloderma croceum (strain F 1598) TaxID=765440 RepID=A0A0C3BVR1_PILCF|nr:hypothetical protein PILCRDRAFT_821554 [Piloderma croceum F 1598]
MDEGYPRVAEIRKSARKRNGRHGWSQYMRADSRPLLRNVRNLVFPKLSNCAEFNQITFVLAATSRWAEVVDPPCNSLVDVSLD